MFGFKFAQVGKACKWHLPLCNKITLSNNLSIFWETSFYNDNRARGKGARCGFSVTLAAATQRVWPVEASWLLTDYILKFWLPDTKVKDESLQVVLSLQTLQNIRFASKSCEPWKVFQPCLFKFSFWWRLRCAASRIIASCLESGSFRYLIWPLFRWFSCFWWQKCSDIHNKRNHAWGS